MKQFIVLLSILFTCLLPSPAEAAHSTKTQPSPQHQTSEEKPLREFEAYLDASINSDRDTRQLVKRAMLKYSNPRALYKVAVTYCNAYKIDSVRARQIASETKSSFLNNPKLETDDALGMKYLFEHVFFIAEENCV